MKNKIKLSAWISKVKAKFHGNAEENAQRLHQKVTLSALVFLVIASVSMSALAHERNVQKAAQENAQNPAAKIVLYYSNSCPHCKNVEKFIADNGLKSKVTFAQKEVGGNPLNAQEMVKKAALCKVETGTLGVPFLWDGENGDKCLMGDEDIIEYFRIKANLQ